MAILPCRLTAQALLEAECTRKKAFLVKPIEMKYRLSSQKEFCLLEVVCYKANELETEWRLVTSKQLMPYLGLEVGRQGKTNMGNVGKV